VLLSLQLHRWNTETVAVAEKQDALAFASSALTRLNPVAPSGACPHGLDEAQWASCGITSVVLAHDWLDGFAGLIGIVEGDGGNVVVEYMGFDDAVEEVASDEAEFAIDRCGGTAGKVPC
jgi:hypothetical protein